MTPPKCALTGSLFTLEFSILVPDLSVPRTHSPLICALSSQKRCLRSENGRCRIHRCSLGHNWCWCHDNRLYNRWLHENGFCNWRCHDNRRCNWCRYYNWRFNWSRNNGFGCCYRIRYGLGVRSHSHVHHDSLTCACSLWSCPNRGNRSCLSDCNDDLIHAIRTDFVCLVYIFCGYSATAGCCGREGSWCWLIWPRIDWCWLVRPCNGFRHVAAIRATVAPPVMLDDPVSSGALRFA